MIKEKMTRKELYKFIKENDLGSIAYELYGRSYSTLSTDVLNTFVANRKEYGNQLTAEEVGEVMANKVPEELRIKSVYLPIIGIWVGMEMLDTTLKSLKGLGVDNVKKDSRILREIITEYDVVLYRSMKPDLYRIVKGIVDDFKSRERVYKHIGLMRFSLLGEALKRGYKQDNVMTAVVELSLCRTFINFALTLDKRFSKVLNETCGIEVKYETDEDGRAVDIVYIIERIINKLGVEIFESNDIKLCEDILFNELNSMDVWSTLS